MQETKFIWHNGELTGWKDAVVHVLSHALHYGTSVFEGIRCYETAAGPAIFRCREHVRRLFDSAKVFRMDSFGFTQEQMVDAMREVVRANDVKSCYLRPVVFRGYGSLHVLPLECPIEAYIACWPWGQYLGPEALEKGVDVCVSSWTRMAPNTLPAMAKAAANYMNSQLILMEASQNGYTEGIALDSHGFVSEGSGENIFLVRDGKILTPPLGSSVLPGITRDTVVKLAADLDIELTEQSIPREALYLADELFFSGTAAEISPIRSVDRIQIGNGARGAGDRAAAIGLHEGDRKRRRGPSGMADVRLEAGSMKEDQSAPSRLPAPQRRQLEAFREYTREQYHTFVGYPCRGDLDYSELYDFLVYPMNNVGDPFAPSTYRLHSREIEREVLAWFAELTHIDPAESWGYVSNGGTEGNIYGLFLARELFPGGIVYYSEDTHYSVAKNLRVLDMKHIMVKSQPSGEIDYDDLKHSIDVHRDAPPILFANIGTTMTEGLDDLGQIRETLHALAIQQFYIHCDAALSGMTLPFQEKAPVFDFRAGIDSISISGHKFIGSPVPCGIVLAKKRYVDRIARSIEYVGTLDTTLTGSRNAITPLFLWYAIHTRGKAGFRSEVAECLAKADYAVEALGRAGVKAWRNPFAITVVFPSPPEAVKQKWQLAVYHGRAHIVTLQSITREQIDELADDIRAALASETAWRTGWLRSRLPAAPRPSPRTPTRS